jgi:hypothetical protein
LEEVEATYNFYFVYKSSAATVFSNLFTLNVVCGPLTAKITSSTFDRDQYAIISSLSQKFVFPPFNSSSAVCKTFTYSIQVSGSDASPPTGLL